MRYGTLLVQGCTGGRARGGGQGFNRLRTLMTRAANHLGPAGAEIPRRFVGSDIAHAVALTLLAGQAAIPDPCPHAPALGRVCPGGARHGWHRVPIADSRKTPDTAAHAVRSWSVHPNRDWPRFSA